MAKKIGEFRKNGWSIALEDEGGRVRTVGQVEVKTLGSQQLSTDTL